RAYDPSANPQLKDCGRASEHLLNLPWPHRAVRVVFRRREDPVAGAELLDGLVAVRGQQGCASGEARARLKCGQAVEGAHAKGRAGLREAECRLVSSGDLYCLADQITAQRGEPSSRRERGVVTECLGTDSAIRIRGDESGEQGSSNERPRGLAIVILILPSGS